MQGLFLMVLGGFWPRLRLTPAMSRVGVFLAIYGCFAAWTANLSAAIWGAGNSMQATPGRHQVEEQIAEGDKVVTRLTAHGKHEGDLPGAPRTGNDLTMASITIHRIANGKLAEKWSGKDTLAFLTQIGVMLPPGQH